MQRRDKFAIVADILTILEKEGSMYKTHIAGKSKLDTRMLERYINMLLDAGLIERDMRDPRLYTITEDGRHYLSLYRRIKSILADHEFNLY